MFGRRRRAAHLARRRVRVVGLGLAALLGAAVALAVEADAPLAGASPNSFVSTGALPSSLAGAVAAPLPDGDVLVAGGESGTGSSAGPSSAAALYSPSTGAFTATGSLVAATADATDAVLPDGDVLVIGGVTGSGASATATADVERYSPATGQFLLTGSLPTAVFDASAAALPNGDVLVVGGDTGSPSSPTPSTSAALYSPTTGSFAAQGPLVDARADPSAVTLSSGDVLVAGGFGTDDVALSSAELYDAGSGTFAATSGPLEVAHGDAISALLPSGDVLVAGGTDAAGVATDDAELYDPSSGTFTETGALLTARTGASAVELSDGSVLVVGGTTGTNDASTLSSVEQYSGGTFAAAGNLLTARSDAAIALLEDGSVLVAGGDDDTGAPLASAEIDAPDAAPAFTSAASANATLGAAASIAITASGNPAPTITLQGVVPSGLTFAAPSAGSATISGDPSVAGTFLVLLSAQNGVGNAAVQRLELTIAPSPALGYVLADAAGTLRGYGVDQNVESSVSVNATTRPAVAIELSLSGNYLISSRGNIFNQAGATFYGAPAKSAGRARVGAFALTPDEKGYWVVSEGGRLWSFGDATGFAMPRISPHTRVVAFLPTPSGRGADVVTAAGNVYNVGQASYFGSPAQRAAKAKTEVDPSPIVAAAITPSGDGYLLVTAAGEVEAYGDAIDYGPPAGSSFTHRVVAIALTEDGHGYYLVTRAGNVYPFGDAPFLGSPAGTKLRHPIVGFAVAPEASGDPS